MKMNICENMLISMRGSKVEHTVLQVDLGCLLKESTFVPHGVSLFRLYFLV